MMWNLQPLDSPGGRCGSGVWRLCGGSASALLPGRVPDPSCISRRPPRSRPAFFGFPSAGSDMRRRRPRWSCGPGGSDVRTGPRPAPSGERSRRPRRATFPGGGPWPSLQAGSHDSRAGWRSRRTPAGTEGSLRWNLKRGDSFMLNSCKEESLMCGI